MTARATSRSLFLLFAIALGFAAEPQRILIPMRDGVRLSAMLALPEGTGPFPVILTRTPYAITNPRSPFVEAGYAVVQQNLRGIPPSEGKWTYFAGEVNDGYDTVEWIAAQSWSNGKIGVQGRSGPGIAGYLTLMSGAPHLSAGVIGYAQASAYDTVTYPGGVYQSALLDSWTAARGAAIPPPFPRPVLRRYDREFQQQDVRLHADGVKVPILHTTGWFDIFTQGTIDYFQAAQTQGTEKARGNQKLIIHPSGHGGALPGPLHWDAGEPAFDSLTRRWFDYWLRDIDTGVHKLPAVQYFVLGDPRAKGGPGNAWRSLAGWPPAATSDSLYLQPGGGLARDVPEEQSASSGFDYSPADPVPSLTARPNDWLNRAPIDQRPLAKRGDILRFTTLPLTAPLEIAGPLTAELFVATTAQDTDFFVRLIDIHPDGFEALMAARPLRLRYREGLESPVPVRKNKVYPVKIDLWSLAAVFPKGHRIRVEVTSSDSPRFDRHTNTWAPVHSYDAAVNATNTVHHSARYPSRLVLPVIRQPR